MKASRPIGKKTEASIRKGLRTGETSPCPHCKPAECCTYISLQIATPTSKADFDDMLWQISHKGVEYFVDGRKWFLLFHTRCRHLDKRNRCGIYEDRFRVCREHPVDRCEFWDMKFDMHFKTYEELRSYADARWARPKRVGERKISSRKRRSV